LRVAFAGIHYGEEPPLVCNGGSGAIFITGCSLRCSFCQNNQLSSGGMGRAVDAGEFAGICLALQERGAGNINIVTGTHAAPAIAAGLRLARGRGLSVPILWNCGGYEGAESLALMEGLVDIYLPDLKTLDCGLAARYFNAPDYPQTACKAITRMMELRPLRYGACGTGDALVSGVVIRHLMLPGHIDATAAVIRWVRDNVSHPDGARALFSLMSQYVSVTGVPGTADAPGRCLYRAEYDEALFLLERSGIDDGYTQDYEPGSDRLPDFSRTNPCDADLSTPVWHWREGYV
jgi:putative pyruvate formate lyase activating enzyme